MSPICCDFFEAWQRELEEDPGMWSLRNIRTGDWYRNAKMRQWLKTDRKIAGWETVARTIHLKDVTRVEDAHSKAFKFGQTERVKFRLRRDPLENDWLEHIIALARCQNCTARCPVLVISVLDVVHPPLVSPPRLLHPVVV